MRRKIVLGAIGIVVVLVSIAITAMAASGSGGNFAFTWETLLGSKNHGYVQIQASYNDSGRHARLGYHRFMREAGPSLDTGRLYTTTATSPSDSTIRSREDWVWDSPLWGDKYITKYYHDFFYF